MGRGLCQFLASREGGREGGGKAGKEGFKK